ncbi:hypothetical protein [Accumulibacter sp.]|uniref:hypothetical protein n=1 Tax=Accumulibacter sp. TaxID=2053492 RepID=UPI00260180C0|nr:hypothetical protein [Accumulibacter sp.]
MKKIVLGAVFAIAAVASMSANAATICAGGPAKDGASVATGSFVQVSFTPKCSANTFVDGVDSSSTLFVVGAGSAKGKKLFVGSSNGGAVCALAAASDCPSSGCTAALTTAATAAEVTAQSATPATTTCPAT